MKSKQKKIISIVLLVVAIIIAGIYFTRGQASPEIITAIAQRQDLREIVSVTGQVKPTEKVDLAFEVSGKIDMVLADVGDEVKAGDSLVKLVNTELTSQMSRAIADVDNEVARKKQLVAALDVELATLDELNRGARTEDINVLKTQLANAIKSKADAELALSNTITQSNQDLENLYESGKDLVNDASIAVDDAISNKTDDMFTTQIFNAGNLVFNVSDTQLEKDARISRQEAIQLLENLSNAVKNFPVSHTDLDALFQKTKSDLLSINDHLFILSEALSKEVDLTDAEKNTFQSNVELARSAVSQVRTAISNQMQIISAKKIQNQNALDGAQTKINEASQAIDLARDQLQLKEVGALPEQVLSQEARVEQARSNIEAQNARIRAAQAHLEIARTNIDKTILRSPIDGVVIRQEAEAGEVSTFREDLSQSVVSIISDKSYQIKTNIPEVDIAKIDIDDIAEITLDAYGDREIFVASVTKIDPAEIVIDGVATYLVTLTFQKEDSRVKSGMTANIDLETDHVFNVIAIPQRAAFQIDGQSYVRQLINGDVIQHPIETGLISWDGLIEVIAGLEENEEVITFYEEK